MAREHLYKAKRKDNGEWVYGLPKYDDSGAICYFEVVKEWARIYGIIPETICEAVRGLKDKNGKQIFEHDIVTTKYGRLCEVCWLNVPSLCGYDLKPLECKNPFPTLHDLFLPDNLEVIGNKFDNDLEVQDEQAN